MTIMKVWTVQILILTHGGKEIKSPEVQKYGNIDGVISVALKDVFTTTAQT